MPFEIIKKHKTAVILSIILGFLMVLPFFYFQAKLGSSFKGILPEIVNDENFYYARVKDVVDGHPFLGNAYLLEHKDELPQSVFLAEYLLAQPIKIFNLNINTAHLIYNFLLPAIAFILTYLALFLVSKSRFWPIIFSIFLFFGLYLLAFIRPVSPQFNFIFWLTQFIFLWLLINSHNNTNTRMYANDTNKMRDISHSRYSYVIHKFVLLGANALNFGLLFYIYPYYWTFYLIFFGILIAVYFWKNRELALKIAIIAAGGLILAIPYFYFNYLSSRLPYYTETLTRLGMIYTRFPSGIRIVFYTIFGLTLFGLALWKKIIKVDVKTLFFISGILASAIAVNQHLITGKNIEFSSHYDMAAVFFLVFAMAYLVSQYNANTRMYANDTNKKFVVSGWICILGLLVGTVFYGLCDYSKRAFAISESTVYQQNYMPVFEWLNKNTEKDSVVYANADLSRLIPVYTANNVFYIREANLFFISDKEVLDRFILNNFFSAKGGSQPEADQPLAGAKSSGGEYFSKNFITRNERAIYGVRYIDAYGHTVQGNKLRRLLGVELEPEINLPDKEIAEVVNRAKELQGDDFIKELKQYRIDYLIWDKNKNPEWKINSKNFSPVFQNGDFIIFKFVFFNS
ncbi:MAG: hypothetical protein ABIG73_01635 [Patescibacteria group bacterium]